MSTYERDVLELARRAWEKAGPDEAEVEAAVRRARHRLRIGHRVRRSRVPSLIVAFGVVLLCALAYAAVQGHRAGQKPEPARSQSPAALEPRRGVAVPPPEEDERRAAPPPLAASAHETARSERELAASTPSAGVAQPQSTRAAPGESASAPLAADDDQNPSRAERAAPTWRDVDDALGAHDDKRAARALNRLATSGDLQTRLKARLGLAQLAASRGNCAVAREIATGIVDEPGVDPALARRALGIARRCQ